MLNDEGPNGKSYILALNEYSQHHFRSDVQYIYDRRDPYYSATAVMDGLTYATERNPNKRVAKILAARATAEVLLPEFRDDGFEDGVPDPLKLAIFDNVDLADDRIPEITMAYEIIKPYRILLICLHRNFGYRDSDIEFMTHAPHNHLGARLTMSVGSHSVSVPMSRYAKQEAAQTILMNVHPHLISWGSLIRMYIINAARTYSEMRQLGPLQDAAHMDKDPSDFEDNVVPYEAVGEDKGQPRSLGQIDDSETEEEYEDDDDDDDDEDDAETGSDDSDEEENDHVPNDECEGAVGGVDFAPSFEEQRSYFGQLSFGDLPAIGADIDSDFEEKLLDPLPICNAPIMTATVRAEPAHSPTPWRVMERSLADEPDGWAPWPPLPPTVQPLPPPPGPMPPMLPVNYTQPTPPPTTADDDKQDKDKDPRTVLYRLLLSIHDLKIESDEDDDEKPLPGNITPAMGSLHIG